MKNRNALCLLVSVLLLAGASTVIASERPGSQGFDWTSPTEQFAQWLGDLVDQVRDAWMPAPGGDPGVEILRVDSSGESRETHEIGRSQDLDSTNVCAADPNDDLSDSLEGGPCIEPYG